MHTPNRRFTFQIALLAFIMLTATAFSSEVHIRVNQLGFLPDDSKQAVVFSDRSLQGEPFSIVNVRAGREVQSGYLSSSTGEWGRFRYHHIIDFSNVTEEGVYRIEAAGRSSSRFTVGVGAYEGILDSLLLFFRVQRCGPTNPILHEPCHLSDSPVVIGDQNNRPVDVTGGWHDAGDYIKFLSTTALSTYLLILSYENQPEKFEFDHDANGVPDILDEVKIGLDWLLRCNYKQRRLITQVQDMRDHDVGWRMPEDDTLRFDRPAFAGLGKNQVGIFSAVMASASVLWRERIRYPEFADQCLEAARKIYSIRFRVPDVDTNPSGMYQEEMFYGKLSLGAVELYRATGEERFLREAVIFADSAGADHWWSWGDVNALAHYRLGAYHESSVEHLKANLESYTTHMNESVFGNAAPFGWGTTNTLLGAALTAMLYERLTGDRQYRGLAIGQRDYILGKNPWGISFIHNIGRKHTRNFHHQVAHFRGGYLPGGIAAGPVPASLFDRYEISIENHRYSEFNSEKIVYFDDRNDYLTNEPTIVTNATALYVFGFFISK